MMKDEIKVAKEEDLPKNCLRPFEWLTGPASVVPIVESALKTLHSSTTKKIQVLHVGSGNSVLGEHLLETLGDQIQQVVNVDKDVETLHKMEHRWKLLQQQKQQTPSNDDNLHCDPTTCSINDRLLFVPADFADTAAGETIPFPAGYFDMAIDKSTLDCTLCSDSATAGLLTEVYRLLNPQGGTYIVISFHHIDLLQPLLENIPGADWVISRLVIKREVEDLIGNGRTSKTHSDNSGQCAPQNQPTTHVESATAEREGAWASGSFEPDEEYRRTVNVMICRRQGRPEDANEDSHILNRDAVVEHVNKTNDCWFQHHNPMLTSKRKETIQQQFNEYNATENSLFDLQVVYNILFTEAEREHLTYDLFLEDWEAWVLEKNDPTFPIDKMSEATALEFLEAMQ